MLLSARLTPDFSLASNGSSRSSRSSDSGRRLRRLPPLVPTTQRGGARSRRLSLAALAASKSRKNKDRPASETNKCAAAAGRQQRKLDASQPPGQVPPPERILLAAGITDLAPFSAASHLALSEEAVRREVQPKLAAFLAEGVGLEGMTKLLCVQRQAVLWCDFKAVFQPNWRVLQQIVPYMKRERHPAAPQRTTLGAALVRGPNWAARFLSRDPQLTQQLLAWLEGSFGIDPEQLAGSPQLFMALYASVPAASAVATMLQERGVSAAVVGSVFLRSPSLFQFIPATLDAKLGALQQELDVPAAEALRLVLQQPQLLGLDLAARLPPLLDFLDGYMGQPGAGRRLVLKQPVVGTGSAAIAQRTIAVLEARGYRAAGIRTMVSKFPQLLKTELDSPLHRQKLDWIETVSPWTLDDFLLRNPVYLASSSTRRLASRLALLQHLGVAQSDSPSVLATYGTSEFIKYVNRHVQPPQPLGVGYVKEWEVRWLETEEGRKWGFPPLDD